MWWMLPIKKGEKERLKKNEKKPAKQGEKARRAKGVI